MIPAQFMEEDAVAPMAESLCIFVCDDDHVHLVMAGGGGMLGEHVFTPEEALVFAKKIEAAADHAMEIG